MLNYAKYKQVKAINHKNKISVEGEKVSKDIHVFPTRFLVW